MQPTAPPTTTPWADRLSPAQLEQAIELKIGRKTWNEIATAIDVPNTRAFREFIRKTLVNADAKFTVDFEFSFALDFVTLDELMSANVELAMTGSEKHVSAVTRIIKTKMDLAKFMIDMRTSSSDESTADDATVMRESEEFNHALNQINASIQAGEFTDTPPESLEPSGTLIDDEDMDRLKDQFEDLSLYYESKKNGNDEEEIRSQI